MVEFHRAFCFFSLIPQNSNDLTMPKFICFVFIPSSQYFGVKVYETPFTFQYLLEMQYEGMIETDTLKIPNFGTWPVVEVHKGADKLSCIIGFLDKQKSFKEYKMLSAKGDKLSLVTLNRYGVGVYSSSK